MANLRTWVTPKRARSRIRQSFLQTIKADPWLAVGFALWWAWIVFVYQSITIFPSVVIGEIRLPSCIGPIISIAITLVIMAMVYYRRRYVLTGTVYFAFIGTTMTLGMVLIILWHISGSLWSMLTISLYILASLISGVGSAFMYTEFNRVFGWLGMLKTMYFAIVSIALGSLLITLLSILPKSFSYGFLIASPFLMVAVLRHTVVRFPKKAYVEHGQFQKLYIPIRFILTSMTEGLSFGLMLSTLMVGGLNIDTWGSLWAHLLAITLFICGAFLFKMDFNMLIYQVSFSLMAFGFLLIACFLNSGLIGSFVLLVGYVFLDLLLWALGSYLIKNAGLPATWMTACPSGALFTGLSIGSLSGALIAQYISTQQGYFVFSAICACALLFFALIMSSNKNFMHGWGTIRPGLDKSLATVEKCCRYLAVENELTRRESDIILLLAQGKKRRTVATMLFITENTIKTHVRNAYRKLHVKSQNELIELVERTKAFLED
jgi:DNA-binding CsgD family transcriptional regulator